MDAKNKLQGEVEDAQLDIDLPEIHPAFDYLVGLFYRSGQCLATGNGLVAITWEELRAFRLENRLDLDVWERGVLKDMSEAYVNEYHRATEPDRKSPYNKVEEQSIVKAMNFRSIIRAAGKK